MKNRLSFKLLPMFLLILSAFLLNITPVQAQQSSNQKEPAPTIENSADDIQNADVSITANITAKELKFEVVPNPKVEFPGTPERKTLWEADRQNLPKPVEPGVTYRNIGIKLRISSRFADIERIVAEALGEIPMSEDSVPADKIAPPQTENSLSTSETMEVKKTIPALSKVNKKKRR